MRKVETKKGTEELRKVEVGMRKGEAEERRKSECGNGERNGETEGGKKAECGRCEWQKVRKDGGERH